MVDKIITAEEAAQIAGQTPEEAIKFAGEKIKEAAKNGKRSVALYSDFFTYGGYDTTNQWREVKKRLENLGYRVLFVYEEKQFVNMYTKVSW